MRKSLYLKISKSLILIILASSFYLLSFIFPAYAQNPTPTMFYMPQFGQNANGSLFSVPQSPFIGTPETLSRELNSNQVSIGPFTTSILTNTISNVIVSIGGSRELAYDQNGKPYYSYQGGAAEILGNLTSSLYTNKPASSVEYLADLGSSLGIVKPAYAQGLGFAAFSPVLELWKTFRNIAYLAFVVIFIIIGFMVMFRKKIDPRTVVTVQDAIPRIIVTLIIITFSYAIAGLIIDLADLTTKLALNLFAGKFIALQKTGEVGISTSDKINRLLNADIFHLVNPLRSTGELFANFKNIGFSFEGKAVAVLAGLAIDAVFYILAFFVMFKIFFSLISPYVSIVLSIVFAPLILLKDAVPGSKNGVMGWIKGLLANIAVFPVTFIMLAIAAIFKSGSQLCQPYGGYEAVKNMAILGPADWATKCEPVASSLWVAPGIGNWGPLVGQLVSFGILFAIPKVAEMVKASLEVKEGIAGQVAGQEIKGGLTRIPIIGSMIAK